jgi:hypothetical protein
MTKDTAFLKDIHEYLEYKDGGLYWKKSKRGKGYVGKRYGGEVKGYRKGAYNGKQMREHRLIWYMIYGYLPNYIDHIDGNGLNNKIENLREVTYSQNNMNVRRSTRNTTGCKGVSFYARTQKYLVQITANKERINLGYYDDLELDLETLA